MWFKRVLEGYQCHFSGVLKAFKGFPCGFKGVLGGLGGVRSYWYPLKYL